MTENCLTCKHWQGDREKSLNEIKDHGFKAIDIDNGWPEFGGCRRSIDWMDIKINGDATAEVTVAASFGCVLHEEVK